MEIKYFFQNITLSGELRDFLEEKIQKLSHFSDKIIEARVDLSYNPKHDSNKRVRLEIYLVLPKRSIYSEIRAPNLQQAVDLVEKKLKKQLEKYREFGKEKRRETAKIIREKKSI